MNADAMGEKVTRPVLRYHGGKWRIAPWVISHFPEHCTYVEPFCGAASVLLRKPRSHQEIINDTDSDIVNLFRVLRDRETAEQLCSALELTPFSREEFEAAFEKVGTLCPVESARRLVARSFMGFGSSGNRTYITGFRAASKQSGRSHALDWANVPECLHAVIERLKGVVVEHRDALEIIKQQDAADTLFYVDPPYLHSTRPNSNCCQYRFEFSTLEHVALARVLHAVKGKVLLSGYASPLYDDDLYRGWGRVEISVKCSTQRGSGDRTEVLWMNFPTKENL